MAWDESKAWMKGRSNQKLYQALLEDAAQAPARNSKRKKIVHPEVELPWAEEDWRGPGILRGMKVQRLRVTFTRGEQVKYITHLDLMRFWERALRRAEIPVAYSEGFSPHPQLALAAPLAV